MQLEDTRAPDRKSFLPVSPTDDFPIQNLPFGVYQVEGRAPRCGVAIGQYVLDLATLHQAGLAPCPDDGEAFSAASLNGLAAWDRDALASLRCAVSWLLDADNPRLRDDHSLRRAALLPRGAVTMRLPMRIGDFTDFYASRQHATNVGTMFRGPEQALQPNWVHLPVAYHGRAGTILTDGESVTRPWGQVIRDPEAGPELAPTAALDFELEMGALIGRPSQHGWPVSVAQAMDHVFGFVLVNDWSARDIQRWEYVPLGPFLGKNFATSVSPWVVTLDALEPFRCGSPPQSPEPLPYLKRDDNGAFAIGLEAELTGADGGSTTLTRGAYETLYWSLPQMIAHHTINGCRLRTGDLLASGTISGDDPDSLGCLLEITRNGASPLRIGDRTRPGMLHDGDRVTLRGWAQGDGYRVGFGELRSAVLPAIEREESQ